MYSYKAPGKNNLTTENLHKYSLCIKQELSCALMFFCFFSPFLEVHVQVKSSSLTSNRLFQLKGMAEIKVQSEIPSSFPLLQDLILKSGDTNITSLQQLTQRPPGVELEGMVLTLQYKQNYFPHIKIPPTENIINDYNRHI